MEVLKENPMENLEIFEEYMNIREKNLPEIASFEIIFGWIPVEFPHEIPIWMRRKHFSSISKEKILSNHFPGHICLFLKKEYMYELLQYCLKEFPLVGLEESQEELLNEYLKGRGFHGLILNYAQC